MLDFWTLKVGTDRVWIVFGMDYRFCSRMTLCVVTALGMILSAVPAQADECRSEQEVLRAASAVERDLKKTIARLMPAKPMPPPPKKMSRKRARRFAKKRGRKARKLQKTASAPTGTPQVVVAKVTRKLQKFARTEDPARQVAWADFFKAVQVFSNDKGRCKVSKKEAERVARVLGTLTKLREVPVYEIVAVEQLLRYATLPTKESWDSYIANKGSEQT